MRLSYHSMPKLIRASRGPLKLLPSAIDILFRCIVWHVVTRNQPSVSTSILSSSVYTRCCPLVPQVEHIEPNLERNPLVVSDSVIDQQISLRVPWSAAKIASPIRVHAECCAAG